MKFCNGTDEESDVVFDWCSQVVQSILINLPRTHAKIILKAGQEELAVQEAEDLKEFYGEEAASLSMA